MMTEPTPDTVRCDACGQEPTRCDCETDHQCARCGSSADRVLCESCDGDGRTRPGQLYEEDPLWYDEDDTEACRDCRGAGGWWACSSTDEWCETHPLPGREDVASGDVEAFKVRREPASALRLS